VANSWRDDLIKLRDDYAVNLKNQQLLPGLDWPQSEQHWLNSIEQINRILAQDSGNDIADVLPKGRITRGVPR